MQAALQDRLASAEDAHRQAMDDIRSEHTAAMVGTVAVSVPVVRRWSLTLVVFCDGVVCVCVCVSAWRMVLEQSDLKATIATLREENSALHASNAELEVRGAPAVVTHHGLYPIHMCIMDMLGAPVLGQTALRRAPYV